MTSRRWFIAGLTAFIMCASATRAISENFDAKAIVDKFSSVKSMAGSFVQFGPNGEQTGGTFSLERPGKIRFEYDAPSPLTVIADGKSVGLHNTRLKTWNLYPLSKTPMKLVLNDRIDLTDKMVKRVLEKNGLISVLLEDKSVFGNSRIEVTFDKKTSELRQWTITDNQNLETTILLHGITEGVSFTPSTFRIPYSDIRKQ